MLVPSPDEGGLFTSLDNDHAMTAMSPALQASSLHDPAAALRAQLPALRRLLGEPAFEHLTVQALQHSASQGVPPESPSGVPPLHFVHGLIVHGDVPVPDGVPPRLLADVAAVEAAIAEVCALAPRAQHEPRLALAELQALPAAALATASLRPARALRLVPVAFRLAGWLRDVHEGRNPHPPRLGDQHVAVYALPGLLSAHDETPVTWWHGLPPTEGRLLGRLALGSPLGELRAEAAERGWIASEQELDDWLAGWVREGLFAEVVAG
jgi:hypothetical protein